MGESLQHASSDWGEWVNCASVKYSSMCKTFVWKLKHARPSTWRREWALVVVTVLHNLVALTLLVCHANLNLEEFQNQSSTSHTAPSLFIVITYFNCWHKTLKTRKKMFFFRLWPLKLEENTFVCFPARHHGCLIWHLSSSRWSLLLHSENA